MAWTAQTAFTTSCPSTNPKIEWQIFPALTISVSHFLPVPFTSHADAFDLQQNAPNATVTADGKNVVPAITTNRTALSQPGNVINLSWDAPGMQVGPDKAYTTSTNASAPQVSHFLFCRECSMLIRFALVCRLGFAAQHYVYTSHQHQRKYWDYDSAWR